MKREYATERIQYFSSFQSVSVIVVVVVDRVAARFANGRVLRSAYSAPRLPLEFDNR